MKINILTFHNGINYGAFFQVYALQSFLENCGFTVEVLNYKNRDHTWGEYEVFLGPWPWNSSLKRFLMRIKNGHIPANARKIARFKLAQRRLNLTRRVFTEQAISDFGLETVIVGSDEVWNFNNKLVGYDPVYFSQGLNAERLISYAASFGHSPVSDDYPEKLPELLSRFDRISVRDQNSVDWIKKLTGRTADLSLDPCFLHDFQSEAPACPKRNFILVYGGINKSVGLEIQKYAREEGKSVISVGYPCAWSDLSMESISPFEWLGYFANCDSVITSMYHGVVFSLIFNKPFCAVVNSAKRIKIYDLLSKLNLLGRVVEEDDSIVDILSKKMNYPIIQSSLDHLRQRSKEYLMTALQS